MITILALLFLAFMAGGSINVNNFSNDAWLIFAGIIILSLANELRSTIKK